MKILSLIKACLSQDMNLFAYQNKKNASKTKKILLPVILFIIICFSMGSTAYGIADILKPLNMTHVMLTIFLLGCIILSLTEGIYKSQGILFDAKDNDLLFSLPIKKSSILFLRIFKLLLFEYLFNAMFILPAFVVYAIIEHPNINYYLISIFAGILLPILPTVIGCFLGYVIKLISTRSKNTKLVQTFLTLIIFSGIFLVSFNGTGMENALIKNADKINDTIRGIYYPIKLYLSLINRFNILDFIQLVIINIIPLIIFIMLGQKYYLNIITKDLTKHQNKNKKVLIKVNNQLKSLSYKEIKRYFSSPVYIFNTSFGLILMIILNFMLCFKGKTTIITIFKDFGLSETIPLEMLFTGICFVTLYMTSITSSSISLEGKTINITKSLPIDFITIFKSKILYCFMIEFPVVLLSTILFTISYQTNILFFIEILITSILIIFIMAVFGLLINLKYPKLNASNDTEVVKQSMSSLVSVFIGMGMMILSIAFLAILNSYLPLNYILLINIIILLILSVITYHILITKGPKEYLDLNV